MNDTGANAGVINPPSEQLDPRKHITLSVDKQRLLYSIFNTTEIRATFMDASGQSPELTHILRASADDGTLDKFNDVIKGAMANVTAALTEYITRSAEACNLAEPGEISLGLLMPSNFNEKVSGAMNDSLEAYLTTTCVCAWIELHSDTYAGNFAGTPDQHLARLVALSSERLRPKRPTHK